MAGDGGRVPDVSEQRAEVEAGIEAARDAGRNAFHRWMRGGRYAERDGFEVHPGEAVADHVVAAFLSRSDPASVLAALLAESPEATVSAIEALLTSGNAVVAVSALRRSRFENAQPMASWTVEVEAACH